MKSLHRTQRGSAAIGMVITAFFLMFFVVVPLFQMAMEIRYMETLQNRVRTASELACTDMLSEMSTPALSRGELKTNDSQDAYEIFLRTRLEAAAPDVVPEAVTFTFHPGEPGENAYGIFDVSFSFLYKNRFLIRTGLEKRLSASFQFELPLDR